MCCGYQTPGNKLFRVTPLGYFTSSVQYRTCSVTRVWMCAVVASSIRGIFFVCVCCYCCSACSSLLVRELVKHVLNGLNGIRWTSMAGGIRAAGGYSPAAACCHTTTSLSMLFRCGGLPHSVRRQLAVRIPEAHCNGQSSDFTPAFLQRLQSLRMVLPVSVGLQS